MKCIVLRPFPGPGGKRYEIGERISTKGWKNAELLIKTRFIQPARLSSGMEQEAPPPDAVEPEFRPSPAARKAAKQLKLRHRVEA